MEPPSIIVARADAGIGVQGLTWSSWTPTAARGRGQVWWNDCTPDCATGTVKHYPASVAEPEGKPVDTFHLELPQGSPST